MVLVTPLRHAFRLFGANFVNQNVCRSFSVIEVSNKLLDTLRPICASRPLSMEALAFHFVLAVTQGLVYTADAMDDGGLSFLLQGEDGQQIMSYHSFTTFTIFVGVGLERVCQH